MEVSISLALPKERHSVASVRRMCRTAMTETGVDGGVIDDVELAISEACNNAVEHTGDEGYRVEVTLNDQVCRIQISDTGIGFSEEDRATGSVSDERGRGIQLMRALADQVRFDVHQEQGTVVTLEKALSPPDVGERVQVELASLPDELRSRVLAATAHAQVRLVCRRDQPGGGFDVYAACGDRLVVMELSVGADGSVEVTRTHLVGDFSIAGSDGGWLLLVAHAGAAVSEIEVPSAVIEALERPE